MNDNYNKALDRVSKVVLTRFTKQRTINESNKGLKLVHV